MTVQSAAFMAGIVFGSLAVISVTLVWVRHQIFGLGGSMLSVTGITLLGLSIWSGVSFEVSGSGVRVDLERLQQQVQQLNETSMAMRTDVAEAETRLRQMAEVTDMVTGEMVRLAEADRLERRQLLALTESEALRDQPSLQIQPNWRQLRQELEEQPTADVERLQEIQTRVRDWY